MRPAGTTHADEVHRHGRLIARIARYPAIPKLQQTLDAIRSLWGPPDHLHFCLGGFVHWRVQPSFEDVQIVAAHHTDQRVNIRRAVYVALRHGRPHGGAASRGVAAGLADDDALVRIHAARAAAALCLGHELVDSLAERLRDPVWTVRWNAARVLAPTDRRAAALAVLLECQPRPNAHGLGEWIDCMRLFADDAAVREKLDALGRLGR